MLLVPVISGPGQARLRVRERYCLSLLPWFPFFVVEPISLIRSSSASRKRFLLEIYASQSRRGRQHHGSAVYGNISPCIMGVLTIPSLGNDQNTNLPRLLYGTTSHDSPRTCDSCVPLSLF